MSSTKIVQVHGRQVIDSRGNPTVEVVVTLEGGARGSAIVPSGASTGEHEAWELRDGVKERFLGRGVTKAVRNVNDAIAKSVMSLDALDQNRVDKTMIELDGRLIRPSSAPTPFSQSLSPRLTRRRTNLACGFSNISVDRMPRCCRYR